MTDTALKAKAEAFLKMHHDPDILVLPNAWDGASAVVLAGVGFPAIAATSAGVAFARGYPDGETIGRTEMCEEVSRIAALVDLPVTADMEAGYGAAPEDVAETVRHVIAAGGIGANIEDGVPDGSAPLFELSLAVERIAAAREAADALGVAFVVNARTDGYLVGGKLDADPFAESVKRANAYREAGADCTYVPGAFEGDVVAKLVAEIDGPLNILASARTPPTAELQDIGVARVSVGGGFARSCCAFARRAAEELRHAGTYGYVEGSYSNPELDALMSAARGGGQSD